MYKNAEWILVLLASLALKFVDKDARYFIMAYIRLP